MLALRAWVRVAKPLGPAAGSGDSTLQSPCVWTVFTLASAASAARLDARAVHAIEQRRPDPTDQRRIKPRVMRDPAEIVEELERQSELPPGSGERFYGYGVMGLPFQSGHLLGLRRFPASSIGPGYRSVWHRDPRGRWTFYQDQARELACTRYFGAEVDEVVEGPVHIDWTGPDRFEVRAGGGDLEWKMEVASTPVTHLLSAVASVLPDRAWRSDRVLAVMSRVAGAALGAGRVRLAGVAPNGQRFRANPSAIWVATTSRATVGGEDVGEMGPAPEQAYLRDFAVPQRGVFVIARAFFTDSAA
jgi:hypothetical protein